MFAAIKQFFVPTTGQKQAYELYAAIVGQARKPVFYEQWHVDDTLDGRFDCIVLHMCLVLDRLEKEAPRADIGEFMRYLSEAFFADMDRSLREMGVGDTGIGLRVKKMAQAFYGRRKAYQEALGDETALREALQRNVYREKAEVPAACVASLAAYMGRNMRQLETQQADALLAGHVVFSS